MKGKTGRRRYAGAIGSQQASVHPFAQHLEKSVTAYIIGPDRCDRVIGSQRTSSYYECTIARALRQLLDDPCQQWRMMRSRSLSRLRNSNYPGETFNYGQDRPSKAIQSRVSNSSDSKVPECSRRAAWDRGLSHPESSSNRGAPSLVSSWKPRLRSRLMNSA